MASTKGYKLISLNIRDATVKQVFDNMRKDLRYVNKNPELKLKMHTAFKDRCDKYVPFSSGELADASVSYRGVTYRAPYAGYQYRGIVYGPNLPITRPGSNVIVGWYSIPGKEKHPTERILGTPGEFNGWVFGYTTEVHPNATHHWDKEMLNKEGDEFKQDIKELIVKDLKHRERVAEVRANVW